MSTRDAQIDLLIQDDIDYIMHNKFGREMLFDLLSMGFKGYDNYSDAGLSEEIAERPALAGSVTQLNLLTTEAN